MRAAGHAFLPKRAAVIAAEAAELLAAGHSAEHLCRVAEWMGRNKPQWKVIEDAMTWHEAPQRVVPAQRADVFTRQDAIDACGWCDPYGQIEVGDKVAFCKHEAPAAVAATPTTEAPADQGVAPAGETPMPGNTQSLSELFASLRQPTF
ncbi:hypothetical protein [Streptomyces sp. NPDC093109]|uniref:hypothetical protein n=1 Tax=Streptomyces sp. NPDC093109 TaxID=3154977 RepID=UPI00344D7DE9